MLSTPKLRVVLIEDDVPYREFLADEIRHRWSAEIVYETAHEAEARSWVQCNSWDVCVLDVFLASGSGVALVAMLRRRRPDQKMFVFSNYLSPLNRKMLERLQATAVYDG